MITSLGLASDGLLDQGESPSLHMASLGLLRYGGTIIPDAGGGGGGSFIAPTKPKRRWRIRQPTQDDLRRVSEAVQRLEGDARDRVEAVAFETIDPDRLETAIAEAVRLAEIVGLPTQKIDFEIRIDDILLPEVVEDDIYLRILLLCAI